MKEKDIETYLYQHLELFRVVRGWYGRQVRVPSGIIDLLAYNKYGIPLVIEVKLGGINEKAITQVSRYAADIAAPIDSMLSERGEYEQTAFVMKALVGTEQPNKRIIIEALSVDVGIWIFNPANNSLRSAWTFRDAMSTFMHPGNNDWFYKSKLAKTITENYNRDLEK